MNSKYLKLLQNRIGYLAIGRSTLRNQGAPKVVETARSYLQEMKLDDLHKIKTEHNFYAFLDGQTEQLMDIFPGKAKGNWGAARKAINIFLRDCLYNQYLNTHYQLTRFEYWLEVPLDKDVGTKLVGIDPSLPKWESIKSLNKEKSSKYQNSAKNIAQSDGVARVHLDIKFWRDGQYSN